MIEAILCKYKNDRKSYSTMITNKEAGKAERTKEEIIRSQTMIVGVDVPDYFKYLLVYTRD